MTELLKIIKAEFNKNKTSFYKEYFDAKIYRQNDKGKIQIPRDKLNKLIDDLNGFYWAKFNIKNAYSVSDNFLLVCIREKVIKFYDDDDYSYINCFKAMTLDEDKVTVLMTSMNKDADINPFKFEVIYWEKIDKIELVHIENEPHLKFYFTEDTFEKNIPLYLFNVEENKGAEFLINLFTKFARFSQSIDQRIADEVTKIFNEVENLIEEEKNYNLALEVLDKHNQIDNEFGFKLEHYPYYYIYRLDCLIELDKTEESLNIINDYISNFESEKNFTPAFLATKASILYHRKDYLNSLKYLTKSEELTEDISLQNELKSLKDDVFKEIEENFIEIPKNERKTILMSNETFRSPNESFIALNMSNLNKLNFPIGHPKLNEVYIVHPRRNDYYLPLNNTEEQLTLDRISEYGRLLQCLGATYFEVSSNKSDLNQQKSNSKTSVNAKVGIKGHGGEVDYKKEKDKDSFLDFDSRISQIQEYEPYKKPYIPDELVWYHSDINWQKLAKQRLEGENLRTHNEYISLSKVENISSQELKNINIDLKAYFVKAGLNYSKDIKIENKSKKKHTWKVSVKFEDIKKLNETHVPIIQEPIINIQQPINSQLDKYKKDILFMLKNDGVIDAVERKILNKKALKYKLSSEDINQIENDALRISYSDNEILYIEQLEDLLVDGKIDEDERPVLSRYADEYGISKERQKTINNIYIK